jgi:hypothetical protein
MEQIMSKQITLSGNWKLVTWRLEQGGRITYPFGENPTGLLIYTPEGRMSVHMLASSRPQIAATDPLGGDDGQRAAAYSTCLAYFGSYEVQGDVVVHRIDASLFPNWTGTVEQRHFTCHGNELVLRTPPTEVSGVTVANEISWKREVPDQNS